MPLGKLTRNAPAYSRPETHRYGEVMKLKALLLTRFALLTAIVFWASSVKAQDILIGHVAGYTGNVSKDAREIGKGASVLFDSVNASGGINGRKIRLITADDNYKPEETAKLISSMIGKVSALLPVIGSANLGYVMKQGILDNVTLPIVGTIPGNESFRTPLNKNIFHFRAGDGDQLEKIVEHIVGFNIKNIAVLARKNPSSDEGIVILRAALQRRGVELTNVIIYDSAAQTFGSQVKAMQETKPGAIVLLGNQQGIAQITKELKLGGVPALLYAVSYADFKLIAQTAGPDAARGFVISQVIPHVSGHFTPLVKEFRENYAKYGHASDEPSVYHLEGYIAGRLIVEAIRISKDSSPEGVKRGLEQLRRYDLGGYVVDFSPTKHTGSSWVDLSMLGPGGTLVR
jgi:ABC-type branched-subunit amino acid transport system substrate-binding protein